jgi:hypothetical protein
MDNGLVLSRQEFESLPTQKQLSCLYQNQVQTMELISGYRFYYKLTAVIGGFLITGMGILFSFHLGIS